MKKLYIIPIVLLSCLISACDFLNVDDYFDDTFSEKDIFESQYNIERYFNGAVEMLPKEGRMYYWCSVPGATGSDEAVSCGTFNNGFLDVTFPGTDLTTDKISYTSMAGWEWSFNVWPTSYKIIRKVNTILPHIDDVPDMNAFDKISLRAQARFLRAYAYYWILQNQGPAILVGDQVFNTNEKPGYYKTERGTYDQCVEYICTELETAAEGLENEQPVDLFGRPTKGAALALVARLRLQAASPLFNGGSAAKRYFGNFKRKSDGAYYVSQEYDERKWAIAAAAARRVMDLGYKLHTVPADEYTAPLPTSVPSATFPGGAGGIDPLRSYSEMFTGETTNVLNKELIWGTTANVADQMDAVFPIGLGGTNAISIPQRIIDAYRMVDGRDINNSSTEYPYENRPYDQACITTADKQLSKDYILKGGTYKAYENREPRFYASIGFSGAYWTLESTTQEDMKHKVVKYHNGAANGKNATQRLGVYNLTGYSCRKYIHPRDARSGAGNPRMITKTFPLIRYAEILLSYAEALNNLKTSHMVDGTSYLRDPIAIAEAFNQVRYRAGQPGVKAEELATTEAFNSVIQRERMVEFLHENRRYYDICRWGIFEDLEREPLMGLNIEANEWSGFYVPTIISHQSIRERSFKSKYMFMPLHRDELRKVPTLDQNPGWEK